MFFWDSFPSPGARSDCLKIHLTAFVSSALSIILLFTWVWFSIYAIDICFI